MNTITNQTKFDLRRLLTKYRKANPDHADRFRLGADGAAILFDLDDGKRSAILFRAGIDGKLYNCQMTDGCHVVIEKR